MDFFGAQKRPLMMTRAQLRILQIVMTPGTHDHNERVFSRNVAFLGPGAVVGVRLGKKWSKKFVWNRGGWRGGRGRYRAICEIWVCDRTIKGQKATALMWTKVGRLDSIKWKRNNVISANSILIWYDRGDRGHHVDHVHVHHVHVHHRRSVWGDRDRRHWFNLETVGEVAWCDPFFFFSAIFFFPLQGMGEVAWGMSQTWQTDRHARILMEVAI